MVKPYVKILEEQGIPLPIPSPPLIDIRKWEMIDAILMQIEKYMKRIKKLERIRNKLLKN